MKFYKNKKILFRFDAGEFDGFGHLKRTEPLINFLISKGFNVIICTNSKTKNFLNKNLKNKIYFIKKKKESEEKYLNRISDNFNGYIIVIDKLYNYRKKEINDLKKKNEVIFIQNYSSGAKISNKIIFPDDHNFMPKKKNIYTGSKYLVLRDEISKIKKIENKNCLAVSFGGSDPYNLTIKIAKILKKINWKNKTIFFYGDAFKKKKNLIKVVKNNKNFKILRFDFKRLVNARLIISAFGVTTYEVANFKTKNLVLFLNPKISLPDISLFKSTKNLGYYNHLDLNKLKNIIFKQWNLIKKKNKINLRNNAKNEFLKIIRN
jgi:spore coat polysaccharide biosynthesis predicted glycosyltransferase SpsG